MLADPAKLEESFNVLMWRPVFEGVVSLKELDEQWTMEDLLDCHEALNIKDRHTTPKMPMRGIK